MKKYLSVGIILATLLLTACGSSYGDSYSAKSNGSGFDIQTSESAAYYDDFSTGGDYSNTTINGQKVDYSYNFEANGKTNKSKEKMLAYYEDIQDLVVEKGGFVENVYNDYDYYDLDNYSYGDAKRYKYRGSLSFTIQIEEEYVSEILEKLESVCKENKFIVTSYSQRIQNYDNYNVVEHDDDYYQYETISEQELNRRLKYSDISVNIRYYNPRGIIEKIGIGIKDFFTNLFDAFGELITAVALIMLALVFFYIEIIIFYKGFRRSIYKHKKKYPYLYPAKDVHVIKEIVKEDEEK